MPRFQLLPENVLHKVPHNYCGLLLHITDDIGVRVQCEFGVGVAQDAGDGFDVYPGSQGMGGESVAQRVEGDAFGDPSFMQQRFETPVGRVGGNGLPQLERIREDPLAGKCFLAGPEYICCTLL